VRTVFLVVFGYLCGSIPFGVLFARAAGVDVRGAGSGNIGATNVARTAGAGLGILTLLADAGKGALTVSIAGWMEAGVAVAAGAGFAAFVGHVYPPTGRAGGKGVATALGVHAVLCPPAALGAVAAFAAVFAASRFVSIASVVGALTAPLAAGLAGAPAAVVGASAAMAAVIGLRHRENFRRLRTGTEPRFGVHKRQAPPAK
jgi:glycerol-3-phosphate acyltransferase PlsY